MAPLRIALATEFYYPTLGGVAEHVHGLANQLTVLGHRVVIVTGPLDPCAPHLVSIPPTPARYELIRIGRTQTVDDGKGCPPRLMAGAALGRRLRAIFDEREIDVVHVHPAHQPVLPWAAIAAAPGAVVATEHADFRATWFERLARPIVRGWMRQIDELLFVSPVAREAVFRAFGESDGQIIPNGIDLAWLSTPRPRPSMLERGRPHVLWVSSFERRGGRNFRGRDNGGPNNGGRNIGGRDNGGPNNGGLDTAIQAVRLASQRIPELRLVVVGEDGGRSATMGRGRAGGVDIIYVGTQNEGRPAFYQACEATLVTASSSSFGMPLLEAMAAGSSVIACDLPASRFVLGDESSGVLVPVDDAAGFAGELVDLLHNRLTWQKRVERARARAALFGWPHVAERVEAAYRRAMARTGA